MPSPDPEDVAYAIELLKASKIPLYTCLASLTWVVFDYFLTVEDEIRYIWSTRWNLGKALFLWIRYYTIALAIFDATQIHSFSKNYPSLTTCVAMDATIRVVGALSLWAVEIIMQVRVYALYNRSARVALANGALFLASIGGFLAILVHNTQRRAAVIGAAKALPIPGCPVIHSGIEYAQWIPATAMEGVLFACALGKTLWACAGAPGVSLYAVILCDNLVYFFLVTGLLIFNNLMVVNNMKIPWFSYGPFHSAIGIMTVRMLLRLHKTARCRTGLAEKVTANQELFSFRPGLFTTFGASISTGQELAIAEGNDLDADNAQADAHNHPDAIFSIGGGPRASGPDEEADPQHSGAGT